MFTPVAAGIFGDVTDARGMYSHLSALTHAMHIDLSTTHNDSRAFSLKECAALLSEIKERADKLSDAQKVAEGKEDSYAKALAAEKAADILRTLRESIDKLEEITDNALWPLPKYREILFIN